MTTRPAFPPEFSAMPYRLVIFAAAMLLPLMASAQEAKSRPADPFAGKAPALKPPDPELKKSLQQSLQALITRRGEPTLSKVPDEVWVDVEVYAKAAEWVLRHGEYYGDTAKHAAEVLDNGLSRAYALAAGNAAWRFRPGYTVVRGYRSKIDGSIQPYAVTLPSDYGKDPSVKWRLDVVLHGRDAGLTEVKFIHQHDDKPAHDRPYVQIDIYGRGNNAYRWAGETDVFEVLDSFKWTEGYAGRGKLIDPRRVVLRGFSMGGAGAWHLGLHHPTDWAAVGPGAGFTTTHGYAPVPEKLPDYVEKCLRIYDATDYAENAAMVPVVAYAGEKDKQLQAARNIEARLKPMNIPIILLVAPNTEHKLTPEYAKKAEEQYARFAGPGKGRPSWEEEVRFTTYTLKYSGCGWVELLGLDRHYDKASVEGLNRRGTTTFDVRTANVRRMCLFLPVPLAAQKKMTVTIDGQTITIQPGNTMVTLARNRGTWGIENTPPGGVQKVPEQQGPIDDAFTDAFLCVRGTGTPWNARVGQRATAELDRFAEEWDKFLRGRLPVKDDSAVTAEDVQTKNLILFGDPASNSLIAKVLPKLPVEWTKESITLGGTTVSSADHMPVLIQPNPLNSQKYVVLNSGHTFHADAFRGSNAMLFPRLGDYAVLKFAPTAKDPLAAEVVTAGLFDEYWKLPGR